MAPSHGSRACPWRGGGPGEVVPLIATQNALSGDWVELQARAPRKNQEHAVPDPPRTRAEPRTSASRRSPHSRDQAVVTVRLRGQPAVSFPSSTVPSLPELDLSRRRATSELRAVTIAVSRSQGSTRDFQPSRVATEFMGRHSTVGVSKLVPVNERRRGGRWEARSSHVVPSAISGLANRGAVVDSRNMALRLSINPYTCLP